MPDNVNPQEQNNPTGVVNVINTATAGVNNQEDQNGKSKVTLDYETIVKHLESDKNARHDLLHKYYQSDLDSRVTIGIESWKKNNLKSIINEEINKHVQTNFPQESAEQKRLRDIESKMAEQERIITKERLKNTGMGYANNLNLILDNHVDWFIGETDEETRKRLDWLKDYTESAIRKGRTEAIGQNARVPQSGDKDVGTITVENFSSKLAEARKRYGNRAFVEVPELRKFYDENASKIKL